MISSRALLKKALRKIVFSNVIVSFGDSSPMLKSCWIHSKNNNFLSYCSAWWNDISSETYESVQNLESPICRCSARYLILGILQNSQKYTCRSVSFFNEVASKLWQNFMSNIFIE